MWGLINRASASAGPYRYELSQSGQAQTSSQLQALVTCNFSSVGVECDKTRAVQPAAAEMSGLESSAEGLACV